MKKLKHVGWTWSEEVMSSLQWLGRSYQSDDVIC